VILPRQLLIVLLLTFASCGGESAPSWNLARRAAALNVGTLDLLAVDLIDSQTGLAVGDIDPSGAGGAIYRTLDGGESWRPIARTNEILTTIHFVSLKIGWVAGHSGRIERTDDGGLTWKPQRIEREGEVFNSIFFIDERRGWVVGGGGLVFRTTNGGETWNQIATARVEDLWACRFSTPERGWIVGEDGLILSTSNGGNSWMAEPSGTSRALLGVAVAHSTVVIAVGEAGTILRREGNSDWDAVESAVPLTLNAVAVSGKVFCAVGAKGTTLESTNDGRSWTTLTAVSTRDLNSVDLTESRHSVAVGQRGVTQLLQAQ
jgi:photosystem II stability/assembly factor-like uncharacterized protein